MLEITIVNFESQVKNCDFEHFEQEWTKASVKIPSEINLNLISRCFDETFITPKKARTFHISTSYNFYLFPTRPTVAPK